MNRLKNMDWKKLLKNAIIFLGPALLVVGASAISAIPSDWRYGAMTLYILNILLDMLRKYLAQQGVITKEVKKKKKV